MVFALVALSVALVGWLILLGDHPDQETTSIIDTNEPVTDLEAPAGSNGAESSAGLAGTTDPAEVVLPEDLKPSGGGIGELVDRPVRNVTPPDVTQGPEITEPLRRVAGPFKLKPAPRPQQKVERFFKPIIIDASTIETASGAVSLAGIDILPIDEVCPDDGDGWPCGRMSRAALQRFVRGRAIECRIPAAFGGYPATLTCTVAGQDIGAWLIRHGWAKPVGEAYSDAATLAREEELGVWGTKRPN